MKEMWTTASGTAGGRCRRQHETVWTELDGDKWTVTRVCSSEGDKAGQVTRESPVQAYAKSIL